MNEKTYASREAFEKAVIQKAIQDDSFRQELIDNPRAVFEKELGRPLISDDIKIEVLEESPSQLYLVLPPSLQALSAKLSDDELDNISGAAMFF